MKSVAKIQKLKSGMTVLDFGAGEKHLKKFLPFGVKYISCDINPLFKPDISSLAELKQKPDIVFASNVFEHLTESELRTVIKQILALKPKYLIVAIPRETSFINKFLKFLCKFTFEHAWEHKLGWKKIVEIHSYYFEPIKVKNFFFLQWIMLLKPKV